MTHTLHRSGTKESLSRDYPILVIAAQSVNAKDSGPQFKKALEIILKHNPVNIGDMRTGNYFRKGLIIRISCNDKKIPLNRRVVITYLINDADHRKQHRR